MATYKFNKDTGKIEKKQDEHPAYVTFLPPPSWRILSGQHRRPSPKAHSNPSHGAGAGAGGTFLAGISQQIAQTFVYSTLPSSFTRGSRKSVTLDDYAKMLVWPSRPPEPVPPTIPYAGIRTGEVIGHRTWWILPEGLCSLAHHFIWQPGATIEGKLDQVVCQDPFWHSTVIWGGVYAHTFANDPIKECNEFMGALRIPAPRNVAISPFHPTNRAIGLARGTVKLWGEVIEHEKGWRAQFAKLASIEEVWALSSHVEEVLQILRPHQNALGHSYDIAPREV